MSKTENSATKAFEGRGKALFPDEPLTLAALFSQAAAKCDRPDALNFKCDAKWQNISSREMIARAENIALGLYSLGLRKGDRVAILAENSPEWTLADAGSQFAGIIDVPIYTTLAPASIQYILNDSGARLFFIQNSDVYERLHDILGGCSLIEKLVVFDTGGINDENAILLSDLENLGIKLRSENPDLIAELSSAIQPNDVATLIYTSGTTGEPKGVMLSHTNIISNVIDAGEKYNFAGDDISLSVLPLCHIFERTGMYLYILNGMAVYYAESIEKVPDNLQEVRPTLFIGVPRIFEKVYARARLKAARSSRLRESIFDWAIEVAKDYAYRIETEQKIPAALSAKHSIADRLVYAKFREFFGGRLRFCVTGGAALSDDIWLIFTGSGVRIMQGYGLTETSPVISSNNPYSARLSTVGKPIRNVTVRVASDGEIEVNGPGVMLGYYKKDDATRDAFTQDGWFRTGDIGTLDADGFLTITDRKKELFKTSGGKYIAPSPIEQMIRASRFVSQAVLVGNERKFPAALIVPNFEQLESYAHLKGLAIRTPREFCNNPRIVNLFERQIAALTENLSQYEKVKKIVLLENELTVEGGELTPTLKVKRRVIDEKYKSVIDKIYADAEKDRIAPALTT
ncbi:MAG TPA: long-chain fatty acid--CoA ligase [Pyrinomonadaceae bacterium]|nr:long-chain fatty acid--CoA ligase [Pyrinomonadaceae bacterium]